MKPIYYCEVHGLMEEEYCSRCQSNADRILTSDERRSISDYLAWALRHKPEIAGITLDNNGWADLEDLAESAQGQYEFASPLAIEGVVRLGDKGRYEKSHGKVRALYGHSVDVTVTTDTEDVPDILFHGTPSKKVSSILEEGLKPMNRNEVHLSPSVEQAVNVGERHDNNTAVLEIDANAVQESGQRIEKRGKVTYTTDTIDPKYIQEQ